MRLRERWRPAVPERAEDLVRAAAGRAAVLGHDVVGTEHVLWSLAGAEGEPADPVLAGFGLSPEVLRRDIERLIGPCTDPRRRPVDPEALAALGIDVTRLRDVLGDPPTARPPGRLPVARRLRRALRLADAAGPGPLTASHVLLGLATVRGCAAQRILASHGVDRELLLGRP